MEEQAPKRSVWSKIGNAVTSPASAISNATKNSPLITLVAIMLVVQPVIQTGIELVKGLIQVKHDLDPSTRPVTKEELDIVNQKIDFNNELIITLLGGHVKKSPVDKSHTSADNSSYEALQSRLASEQKKLDADFSKGIK